MALPQTQPKRIIDLRKHPRISLPAGALFSFRRLVVPVRLGEVVEGEGAIVDLSIGGCRLLSDMPLNIGQEYNLILQISLERPPIPVDAAVVRWTDASIYGLKFTSVAPHDESQIRDLLLDIRRSKT
ncbi:MAG: hypothetical protein RL768_2591 [Nitrospirota bacterium]|jgi:hypothetical protein